MKTHIAYPRTRTIGHRLFATLAIVGVVSVSAGTFAAFTATTDNTGNTIATGTVAVSQHAGSVTLYNVSNQSPSNNTVKCLRVTYTGTLAASLRFYISSAAPTNGDKFNITVDRAVGGTGLSVLDGTMSCTNFGTGGAITTARALGLLNTFPLSYAAPGVDGKAAGAAWATNDWVDYRFTITPVDNSTANARTAAFSTGAHTFTWQAVNN